MKRWKLITLILAGLALVLSVGCLPARGNNDAEFAGEMITVVRGNLIVSVSANGSLAAVDEADLSFDGGGEVYRINVEEGDMVSQGSPLAILAPYERETLEIAVTQAEVALSQAEYNLDKAENPFTDEEIADAEQAVEDAEDRLDLADDMLRFVLQHGSQWEVLQWQMEVLNAEIQLQIAEDTLDDMLNVRDDDQIAILRLQVAAAEQTLIEARSALEMETLTAPFTGVVARVNVSEGDILPAPGISQIPVIQMIDNSQLDLVVGLDEIDVPGVRPGQPVSITVDALPDATFDGSVVSVSPLPVIEAGVVFYSVKVRFAMPQDSGIRTGMSATADIILSDRNDALLVPDRAISYDAEGRPMVMVLLDGEPPEISQRAIITGISDGFRTEIVSGLEEGETLVIEAPDEPPQRDGPGFPFGN